MNTQNSAKDFLNNYLVKGGVKPESIEIASRLYDLDLGIEVNRNDGDPGIYMKQYGGNPKLIDATGANQPDIDTGNGFYDPAIRPLTVEEQVMHEGIFDQHRQQWGSGNVHGLNDSYPAHYYNGLPDGVRPPILDPRSAY